jgi:DNA recombination protein RmuC
MTPTMALLPSIILGILLLAVLATVLLQGRARGDAAGRFDGLERGIERTERAVRDETERMRAEGEARGRALREEVAATLQRVGDDIRATAKQLAEMQAERLDGMSGQIKALIETSDHRQETLRNSVQLQFTDFRADLLHGTTALREEIAASLRLFGEQFLAGIARLGEAQRERLDAVVAQLAALTDATERKQEALRLAVEQRLDLLRTENTAKLEQVRQTVDEQLQSALEKRLTESFARVSQNLEAVHKGLGEMQTLATGVGDLKRVLTNVKARGSWGEVRLGTLLEQILTPEQYCRNARTRADGPEVVEYAVRLPGRDDDGAEVLLPIDAKFPQEDYDRLIDAAERADAAGVETAVRQLEARIKAEAKQMSEKYIHPPHTTDFAIMFLPTEGLYAEVIRRPGLAEQLQRSYRVSVAGPTTLAALLNSLQMGFRTLTIQKRSSEVWKILAAVKAEFGKYGQVVDKVRAKLTEATKVLDQELAVRSRAVSRSLRDVDSLPPAGATAAPVLLGVESEAADDGAE